MTANLNLVRATSRVASQPLKSWDMVRQSTFFCYYTVKNRLYDSVQPWNATRNCVCLRQLFKNVPFTMNCTKENTDSDCYCPKEMEKSKKKTVFSLLFSH